MNVIFLEKLMAFGCIGASCGSLRGRPFSMVVGSGGPSQPAGAGVGGGAGAYSAPPGGTLVRWSARRRSLAVCGPSAQLRLWDAHAERLQLEIATQSAAGATALWRADGGDATLACGFADGAVRAWDERAPARPLLALHHHAAPVLAAVRRHDLYTLLSACMNGEVRIYDTRKMEVVTVVRAPGPLAAVDVHPRANLLACGSVNQSISVYDLKGTPLNTIKFHEGFMGARIGPVSCLAFHPLRCALGVGSKDSTVSVYVAEGRR